MTAAEDSYLNMQAEYLNDDDDEIPAGEPDSIPFLSTEDIDKPDEFLKTPPRSRGALQYEKKVKRILISIMRYTIRSPRTINDAAAIIKYGNGVSVAAGDLAAKDKYARAAINFLSEGAGNPYLEFIAAFGILALQILRNHEPEVEAQPAKYSIRIPFTKRRIGLRIRIRLGRLKNMTEEPKTFTAHVLSDPDTQRYLAKYHDIQIQENPNGKR